MNKETIIFNEELYKKNLEENTFLEDAEMEGLSEEDIKKLKEDGLL